MSKSGKVIGEENFLALEKYLAALEKEGSPVPLTADGKPNISAIALACGFDRGVIYKNPRCKTLIEARIRSLGGDSSATEPNAPHAHNADKIRIRELEIKLADAHEQLADCRRRLAKLEQYERLYHHAVETGRDILR
jgi:hypothetical protein